MPELPEVETLKKAITPLILKKRVESIVFFRKDLRFPIPIDSIKRGLLGQSIEKIERKGKYLLIHSVKGALLVHLGMSGRLQNLDSSTPVEPHTHAVFVFGKKNHLHFIDPRRFGCLSWIPKNQGHPLIDHLGPDPFSKKLTPQYLMEKAQKSKSPIKNFLLDSKKLSGIGNIYASESLFEAGIHPLSQSFRLSQTNWNRLIVSLRDVLSRSIRSGGTTLKDFYRPDGNPGYYAVNLYVYGKEGSPCKLCQSPIERFMHCGRSTFFCPTCQPEICI